MTGSGKDATTCRNTPEQRRKQLLYQRARTRAVQDLIGKHKSEFDDLLSVRRGEVELEMEEIESARTDTEHAPEPARLKTGRRAKGQKVIDRIDVARCPHCIKHHDQGHVCQVCGASPESGGKQARSKSLASAPAKQAAASTRPRRQVSQAWRPPADRRGYDADALAEFNAGTQRAANARRR